MNSPRRKVLELNMGNLCNGYCPYCPYVDPEVPEFMSREVINKLPDVIENMELDEVHFAGFSEPTLHPDIKYAIKTVVDTGVLTELLTNALRLDVLRTVIKYDILIQFHSIPNQKKEYYDKLDKMIIILGNKKAYITKKTNMTIRSRCSKIFKIKHHPAKLCNYEERSGYVHNYILERILVDYNGNVLLCCFDWDKKITFGNILTDTVDTIIKRRKEFHDSLEHQTDLNAIPCFYCENSV